MPYNPDIEPSRRWFAARTFLAQPASLMKSCVGSDTTPNPNQLRLAFVNVLRAIRTLHRLAADTNALNQVQNLKPFLNEGFYDSLSNLQATFWDAPDLPRLNALVDQTYEAFFAVYVEDKNDDLFHDMNEYEHGKFYGHYEDAYPLFVKAGLADSIEEAMARYGSNAADAVADMRDNPAYQSALRDLRLQEWRDYHSATFWEFDERHSLERDFPTSYKGLNCIP